MTNKCELAQAAHDCAVKSLDEQDVVKLDRKIHDAFEGLQIETRHFNFFEAEVNAVRGRYLGLARHPLVEPKK